MDQQPLARLEPAHDHERRVCSRVVDGKRGPLVEAERIRQREHLVRGDADQLRVPAEAGAGEHPVADRVRIDPLPHALDLTGDLVADHAGRRRSVRVDPRARHQVGEVDPRGPHGDSDLPGPDCRLRAVLDPQHLRSAVAGDHDCLHGASLSGGGAPRATAPGRAEARTRGESGRGRHGALRPRSLSRWRSSTTRTARIPLGVELATHIDANATRSDPAAARCGVAARTADPYPYLTVVRTRRPATNPPRARCRTPRLRRSPRSLRRAPGRPW